MKTPQRTRPPSSSSTTGAGSLGTAGGQAFALNIANHPGTRCAIGIHQYSSVSPAVQIDNTDVASSIFIKNTENQTQNPGNTGTGAFFQLMPFDGVGSLFLTNDLVWNNLNAKDMRIVGQNASLYASSVETATNSRAPYVSKQGIDAGSALDVLNKGTGAVLNIAQTGAGTGVNITMTDISVAKYAGLPERQSLRPILQDRH